MAVRSASPEHSGPPTGNAEPPRARLLGIGMHSYSAATWNLARQTPANAKFSGALSFLEYAHALGAAGVQVALRVDERDQAARLRARAETLGAYYEGQFQLPKDEADLTRFEADVKAAREAGALVARTAVLGSRRYETFRSNAEFHEFKARAGRSLALATPVVERHRLKLAVENHKDWLAPELVELLRRISSEHVGACVDTGNSIALLEDPYAVIEALAPFALSTHLKDMAVQEHPNGFLLSEVPLGTGFLDIPRIVSVLRKARPTVALNLEMITRDPLRIPCLTTGYWATFEEMKALQLAEALARVKRHAAPQALPRTSTLSPTQTRALEDENVRRSITWAGQSLHPQGSAGA